MNRREIFGLLALSVPAAASGADARPAQSKEHGIVSVKDFGAKGDNATDDTAAFAACKVFCETAPYKTMFVPAGTYLLAPPSVHGAIYSTAGKLRIEGEGIPHTVLKCANNSGGIVRSQTQDFYIGNLTIDMNGKNAGAGFGGGGALWLEANQPTLRDIIIKNQVGAEPAILIDQANLVILDNFRIENCATAVEIGRKFQTLYSRISNGVIGECATGRALKMNNCVGQVFNNVIIEGSPIGAMYLNKCSAIDFFHFQMETGNAALSANSVILLNDCESIHFVGARLNQQHRSTKKKFVQYTGYAYDITWTDVYFLNTAAGWTMWAPDNNTNNRNLSWRNIRGYSSVAMVGISNAGGSNMTAFSIENWNSGGSGPFTHILAGYQCFIKDVGDNFSLTDSGSPGLLINCPGTITGTHSGDRLGAGRLQAKQ